MKARLTQKSLVFGLYWDGGLSVWWRVRYIRGGTQRRKAVSRGSFDLEKHLDAVGSPIQERHTLSEPGVRIQLADSMPEIVHRIPSGEQAFMGRRG